MKILIIGSDSFIAQHFIKTNKNKDIFCISRRKTDINPESVIENLNDIDLSYFEKKTVVINFAAIVHRPEIKDVIIYDKVNYKLTVQNAEKAKRAGVKLFIQISTIAVYGNTTQISIETLPDPQNLYARSKLKADNEILALQDENFKVAIIRPPMVYGGGKAPGNMMRLIKLVDKGIPIPFKNINNGRDFIHVTNLVQYLTVIAQENRSGIFLLSDQYPASTGLLVKTISKHLKKKPRLFSIPYWMLKLIKIIKPDLYDKLFGSLHIEMNFPKEKLIHENPIDQGICEMVQWYKANKQNAKNH